MLRGTSRTLHRHIRRNLKRTNLKRKRRLDTVNDASSRDTWTKARANTSTRHLAKMALSEAMLFLKLREQALCEEQN